MSFQTSVLRDGVWVTETVDLQAALKASSGPNHAEELTVDRPPCGVLSRTIADSPIVNSVHSVRLRSRTRNDIAFVGERFVQISELRSTGQLYEIARWDSHNARIRNAVVYGDCSNGSKPGSERPMNMEDVMKRESMDPSESLSIDMDDGDAPALPPQLLVLILETGELVFLFIQQDTSRTSRRLFVKKIPASGHAPYLGYHMVMDPSSRYMAAASMDRTLIVYQLKPWEELNEEFKQTETITPLVDTFPRNLTGAIYKIVFLYPRPQDDDHIILTSIICPRGHRRQRQWKLVTYDWAVGDDVSTILAQGKPGTLLHKQQFPMLVIPLKFQNALFLVYQDSIGLVKQALSVPEYEFTHLNMVEPSGLYHGLKKPLWSAWSRPFRQKQYSQGTDIIYLAREDGFIMHVELDSETLMHTAIEVGYLNTCISRAFTAASNSFIDLLIITGESGPGGIWKLPARQEPQLVMTLPNWSPVVDVTTTDENTSWAVENPPNRNKDRGRARDSVFLASGRGTAGSITEIRYGIQARIGLDLEIGEPIKQAWLFADERSEHGSTLAILALPHSTAVLSFPSDLTDVTVESPESTHFDTSSRTIHSARIISDIIIQVTELFITLVTQSQRSQHTIREVMGIPDFVPQNAFCFHEFVVLSSPQFAQSRLQILQVEEMNVVPGSSWVVPGEITCISLFQASGKHFILSGEMAGGAPSIAIYTLEGTLIRKQSLGEQHGDIGNAVALEALTSISVVENDGSQVTAYCGTRCGLLLTLAIPYEIERPISWVAEKIGTAAVEVFPRSDPGRVGPGGFICCDSKLVLLTKTPSEPRCSDKTTVWTIDVSNPSTQFPPVHSVYEIGWKLGGSGVSMLLMVAGTRILLADLGSHPGPITRSIPTEGTPTRVIYSHIWKCLVVGYQLGNRPSLALIDPNSCASLSRTTDKHNSPREFVKGLGQPDDRIFSLFEWVFVKDAQTFSYIVATTKSGNLVIVSVKKEEVQTVEGNRFRLRHYTTNLKSFDEPIYSAVSATDGLVYCVGQTLHWDVLNLTSKKIEGVKELQLDSPVTSLSISNGKVLALTAMHSLEVVDLNSDNGDGMKLLHTDPLTRTTSHMITMGPNTDGDLWPVTLLADTSGGIAGVWIPWGIRNKELVPVFEGKLRSSIRRLVRARCRPAWLLEERRKQHFGSILSTTDGAEIFGVSVDGTVHHFTLLQPDLRRFLYLIQSMWEDKAKETAPSDESHQKQLNIVLEDDETPKHMHVDGDVLVLCQRPGVLEDLVREYGSMRLFCRYLDELSNGMYTEGFGRLGHPGSNVDDSQSQAKYFGLAYKILDYLLAPVL